MPIATIAGRAVHLDEEGFMTDPAEWTEEIAAFLASQIGIDPLTDGHWSVIRFLRADFAAQGETATLRRVSTVAGVATKDLYALFPGKPARKMAYVAGLPKPTGCV
ncbi:MAG: TusE/DsrC/DsvC family sulfur relay protein [Actinomycetota bacterium]